MRTRHNNRIAGSILMSLLLLITLAASAYRFADVAAAKPTARIQNVYDDGKDVPKKDNKNNGKNGNGKKPDDTEEPAPKYERIRVDDSESAVFSFKSDKVAGSARLMELRIDGKQDRFWDICKEYKLRNYVYGDETESATFRACCDSEKLYLFIQVSDATPYTESDVPTRKDGVEIFLNEDGKRNKVYEDGDSHFFLLRDGSCVCGHGADGDRVEYAIRETEEGYTIEVAISWSLAANRRSNDIGFDIHINDSRAVESRDGILAWSDTTLMTHEDLSRVGILSLR